jgi:hypothetical protein
VAPRADWTPAGDDCRLGTNNATGLGIETNDVQRMIFRADGNIVALYPTAFGTPLPNPAFGQHRVVVNNHFTGPGAMPLAETALRVTVPASPSNPNAAAFAVTGAANSYPNTAGEERFVVTNAGNVGVGVAAPTARLHIDGNARINDGGAVYLRSGTDTNHGLSWAGPAGFVSCWVLKVDTLETRYVYEFTDSSAYNGFDNGYVFDRMAEMTGCTNPGSNCADACCGRFHAKFYSTVR